MAVSYWPLAVSSFHLSVFTFHFSANIALPAGLGARLAKIGQQYLLAAELRLFGVFYHRLLVLRKVLLTLVVNGVGQPYLI